MTLRLVVSNPKQAEDEDGSVVLTCAEVNMLLLAVADDDENRNFKVIDGGGEYSHISRRTKRIVLNNYYSNLGKMPRSLAEMDYLFFRQYRSATEFVEYLGRYYLKYT